MARLNYLLDTNTIADLVQERPEASQNLSDALYIGHTVYLPAPVHYEVLRGLIKVGSTKKRAIFEDRIMKSLMWADVLRSDWYMAANLWAQTKQQGRQLSDVDLLIAAMTIRMKGILVTSDNDFSILSVDTLNWRIPK